MAIPDFQSIMLPLLQIMRHESRTINHCEYGSLRVSISHLVWKKLTS